MKLINISKTCVAAIPLFFMFALMSEFSFAQGKIFLDVGSVKARKSLLALTPLISQTAIPTTNTSKVGTELHSVISNDLDSTGLFKMVDPNAYLENPNTVGLKPVGIEPNGFRFDSWKSIGSEFLIRGGYQVLGDVVKLEVYAYYVPQALLIIGKKYEGSESSLRKMAHTFANDFVKAVTGKPGIFNTKIVVTIDKGPGTHREIHIADWDGQNSKPITNHRSIAISPTWSRDGKFIAYSADIRRRIGNRGPLLRNWDMFMYELASGRRWLVSSKEGLNTGAEFTPDGRSLLVTMSQGGGTGIFKMAIDGGKPLPLIPSTGRTINVEPAYSPDGKWVAFSSDRSGRPMIYIMRPDGTNIVRKTFEGQYNSTPTWSPDSKSIAFAGLDINKKIYDIFLMTVDGSAPLQRLTSAQKPNGRWANNEDPSFSPDGRQVMFISDRTGPRQLYIVNLDGTNERRVSFDDRYYAKPKWGPLAE